MLELVCEVPVQGGGSEAERIDVRDADEVVLADITVPDEAAVDAAAAPEPALSKFRLVMGAIEPGGARRRPPLRRKGRGRRRPRRATDSRIRLLSRF